jgi:hypothetical protein
MALKDYALVSFDTAKTLFSLIDKEKDLVEFLINSVSLEAESIAKRPLAIREHTVILDGRGNDTIILPTYPVSSITSVAIDSLRTFGIDTETTDYFLNEKKGLIRFGFRIADVPDTVKVVFTGGYGTLPDPIVEGDVPDDIPDDLVRAVLETVMWNLARFRDKGFGKKSETIDGMSVGFEISVPFNARLVFESYRG